MSGIHIVVGVGEVGKATMEVLQHGGFEVYGKDVEEVAIPDKPVGCLHVALNYHSLGHERFLDIVRKYLGDYKPKYLDILSTVAPGTTSQFGAHAVHSTTRGLHPNLVSGLQSVPKHVGGPDAEKVAQFFRKAGVTCVTHRKSETTELAHILNNSAYGAALIFADEAAKLCRAYGVDYFEAVMKYTATHNEGFSRLDHERLARPILTPPGGRIGGHCVVQGAGLIPKELRGPLMERLAHYNEEGA